MPAPEVLRQNIAANAVVSPVGVEIVTARNGVYRGEAVKTSDLGSKIASENVTLQAAQRRRDLHSQMIRMLRKGQAANEEGLSRIAGQYYEKLPDLPNRAALQSLVESMYALMKGGVKQTGAKPGESRDRIEAKKKDRRKSDDDDLSDSIFELLQEFDDDVSHQFAGLEVVREMFEGDEDSKEFMEALDRAARTYQEGDLGREVRAGFACAPSAHTGAATLETDPAALRDAYRAMLREQSNFGQLFDALSKFDILRNLDETIDVFREAAGRDLSSAGPSIDPIYLRALLTELNKLKQIKTVCEKVRNAAGQAARILGEKTDSPDLVLATSRFLNFVAKTSVNLADAQRTLASFEDSSATGKVVYLNGLQVAHNATPDAVIPSTQSRLQQKSVLLSLSNQLVDAEEREYARNARQQGD